MEFYKKEDYIKKFKKSVKNNPKWKIFIELGIDRPRVLRNLEAHEELTIKNGVISGWLKEPDPPITIKEFNEYFFLLIILLWKIYDIFNLKIRDNFIDNLIQF